MNRFWDKWKNWELWPFWMRYLKISPNWFYFCLRSRSLWFFTPSNPTLTFGGFQGEPKHEMYEQLPPGSYPKTLFIKPGISFAEVLSVINKKAFQFPFIVKPDVGMSGILFRKIDTEEQLRHYHQEMTADYLIQDLVPFAIEFSVFYYRYPDQEKGVITGFLQKEPMHVTGDGRHTLEELIEFHPKARFRKEELITRHKSKLHLIIPADQKYYLSWAANLNRGGSFINLHHQIDDRLLHVFDELNHYSKHFYYGRYDLKAESLDTLKEGRNFLLLEYNGSGAEPNHVYNSGYSLKAAHREILKHWRVLFEISRYNHKKGYKYWSLFEGWRHMRASEKHFSEMKKLDIRV